jgi:nitrate/nitrite transport system substrate-binding protein
MTQKQISQPSPSSSGTAQTGAAQTGAAQTGAAQTGAAQTGAAQTGAAQTGAAQTGAAQTGAAQTGARDPEEAASSAGSDASSGGPEALIDRIVDEAVLRAVFRGDSLTRRAVLSAVGRTTVLGALSTVFPLAACKSNVKEETDQAAREAAGSSTASPLEKPKLRVGFIPITCATPIIMAHPMGFYRKYGLDVELVKTAGWAVARDKSLSKEYDASHLLSPMPLAMTLGLGSTAVPFVVAALENVNGQAITLHVDHKDKRDPKQWRGFRIAVPFEYSMHNFLLRYYLAEHGLDPDKDVQIRVMPPPDMVANLRARNVDAYLGPDPFNQRAVYEQVGVIHLLSKELWDRHPCCAFAASKEFAARMPNTFGALFRAIVEATHYASDPAHRAEIASAIAPKNYLNQPPVVVEQVLTGKFADGIGPVREVPDRIDFEPFPWHSMAVWILTQMKRWGYLKDDIDYGKVAEQVFLASECGKVMKELGHEPPASTYRTHTIMGKPFDPTKPREYLAGFARHGL